MKNDKLFNRIFSVFVLIGLTVAVIASTVFKFANPEANKFLLIVTAIGAIAGILSTVSTANGRIIAFLFGFIDVTIYSVMCFLGEKYGNAALHVLYFVPMQFIGFAQWRKRGKTSDNKSVRARRLSRAQKLLAFAVFLVGSIVAYLILSQIPTKSEEVIITIVGTQLRLGVMMDAVSTICNIIGMFLMSTAFADQWIFWIAVNISTIVMWSVNLSKNPSDAYSLIYILKYAFYLLNALNGLRIWLNLSRTSATQVAPASPAAEEE